MNTIEIHKKNQARNYFFSENISLSRSFLIALGYPARLRDFAFLILQSSQGQKSYQITLNELSALSFRKDFLESEKRGLFEPYSVQAIRRALESFEIFQESQGIYLVKWIPNGKFSRMEVPLWDHFNEIYRRLIEKFERIPKEAYKEECEKYADELLEIAVPNPITREEKKEKRNREILESLEKQAKKAMSKDQIKKKIEFASEMEERFRQVRLKFEKMLYTGNSAYLLVDDKNAHIEEEDQHGEGSGYSGENSTKNTLESRADLEAKKEVKIEEDTRINYLIKSDRDGLNGLNVINYDKKTSYQTKKEEKKSELRAKEQIYGIKKNPILAAKKQVENFVEMGAKKFDLVYWKNGKKSWCPDLTKEDIFNEIEQAIFAKKPILTPKSSLLIIKLDDVNEELLKKLNPVAFQVVETSKNSYHVWLGFQDKVDIKDIRYRIVKKLVKPLDLTDSGESTRLAGSKNEKHDGFLVQLKKSTNYLTSESELIERGILDKKESPPQKPASLPRADSLLSSKVLPAFNEFEARAPQKENGEKDISRAIFRWTLRALELGFRSQEILPELELLCGHKKRRNKKVAQITYQNAIDVMAKRGKL